MVTKPRGIRLPAVASYRVSGRLATPQPVPCVCGYDLVGLPPSGPCPECGRLISEIGERLYRAPAPTAANWFLGWFDPKPTASLMELDPADIRRMIWATVLAATGIFLVALGAASLYVCQVLPQIMDSFGVSMTISGDVAAICMLGSGLGGASWVLGLTALLWPRAAPLRPRPRRRPLGALGATSFGNSKSAYEKTMRWVGEWWPKPVRIVVLLLQGLLPLAALASAVTLQTKMYWFGILTPSVQPTLCRWLWAAAALSLAPACLLLMDFAYAVRHDSAIRKLRWASFGMVPGLVTFLGMPQIMAAAGGPALVLGLPIIVCGWVLLPVMTIYLVSACWALFFAACWVPRHLRDEQARYSAQLQRDIAHGQRNAEGA